jgi:hypothetical protein
VWLASRSGRFNTLNTEAKYVHDERSNADPLLH